MKGFKEIESLSLQVNSDRPAGTVADDSETNKGEMAHDDITNDVENETGPELPLPIPNLFPA